MLSTVVVSVTNIQLTVLLVTLNHEYPILYSIISTVVRVMEMRAMRISVDTLTFT